MTILHAEIMIQDDVRCNGDIAQRIHIKNMLIIKLLRGLMMFSLVDVLQLYLYISGIDNLLKNNLRIENCRVKIID